MPSDTITWINEEGEEMDTEIPSEWKICPCCRGEGKTLIDGLRGVAFTREDFDEDPDFLNDMRSGMYDTQCDECGGSGKVLEPVDYEQLNDEQKAAVDYAEEQARFDAEERAAYRMEMGYRG